MYLNELNEDQRSVVVNTEGYKLVVAGAGSGKTKTSVTKVMHLIKKGVSPHTIWVCTFTKQATSEIRERIVKEIGDTGNRVKVGTLHSIAYSVYKNGLIKVDGYNRYQLPSIMINEGKALFMLYAYLKANAKVVHNNDAKGYLGIITTACLRGVNLSNFEKHFRYDEHSRGSSWCFNKTLHACWKQYDGWKKKNNTIDFPDMLILCQKMLKDDKYSDYLKSIQNNVKYMLIDEAQDTNAISYDIAEMLSDGHNNLTIIGDTRQCIYNFQGADISNIHAFIKRKNPNIFELKINYRSTKTIVDNSNKFIKGSSLVIGSDAAPFHGEGKPIGTMLSESENGEAVNVVNKVMELVSSGYNYEDIMILYRVHSQSVLVEANFTLRDIPYITYTDDTFFDRREVKDITTYLKMFSNPSSVSEFEFKSIVNRPTRYISSNATTALIAYAKMNGISYLDALEEVENVQMDNRNKRCFNELLSDLHIGYNKVIDETRVTDLINYVLKDIGYEEWLNKEKNKNNLESDVTMNFDSILSLVNTFNHVEDYVNYIDKVKQQQKARKENTGNYVKMMTFHASKGKESPVVITLGNCTRLAPFHRNDDVEEERRLMYVAITRPEKELHISIITEKLGRFKVQPSPFLYKMNIEIDNGEIEYD